MITQTLYRTVFTAMAIAVTTGLMLQISLLGALAIEVVGFGYAFYALQSKKNVDHLLPAIITSLSAVLVSAFSLITTAPYAVLFLGLTSCGVVGAVAVATLTNTPKEVTLTAAAGLGVLACFSFLSLLLQAPGSLFMLAGSGLVSGITVATYIAKTISNVMEHAEETLLSYIGEENHERVCFILNSLEKVLTENIQQQNNNTNPNGRSHDYT